MDHTAMHRQAHAGVQMDHVLLLNNAYYVDSIKDTWAERERAGPHSSTVGSSVRASPEHPWCNLSQNVPLVGV